jgi:hypothetical protein
MSDVKTVLENLGYQLKNDGSRYFRAKPLYRDSDNATALSISKKHGGFVDFAAQIKGSLSDLVQLTLGFKTKDEAKSWLANHEFDTSICDTLDAPIIEDATKYYSVELLDKLVKNHTYWNKRNVPTEIISNYQGGVVVGESSLNGRYVFPMFDDHGKIIGFAGRDIAGNKQSKWKLIGKKANWIYPQQNLTHIRENKEVILVESIGDELALKTAEIHTGLVLFGVSLSDRLISKIVGLNPKRIILALNNDSAKNNVGQDSSVAIAERLLNFFDPHIIVISIPEAKDLGEMTVEQIKLWYEHTILSYSSN